MDPAFLGVAGLYLVMVSARHDFEEFYELHRDRLVATLNASMSNLDLCSSAVDEAMVRAFARWDRVGRSAEPAAWVFVTARNVARRQQKRRHHTTSLGPATIGESPAPAGETWLVVAGLPQRQREAVTLRHVLGLTEQGVAEAMGVTRGTVSSTLRDAYRSLGTALSDNDGQEVAR